MKGRGQKACTKVENWGTKALQHNFSYSGERLPAHTCDVEVWKYTVWKLPSGRIHHKVWEELKPNNKGDKQQSLRVFVGGRDHSYHRIIAFMYANDRGLTWEEFNAVGPTGEGEYEVNHMDGVHSNNTRNNLEILTREEHMAKDGRL